MSWLNKHHPACTSFVLTTKMVSHISWLNKHHPACISFAPSHITLATSAVADEVERRNRSTPPLWPAITLSPLPLRRLVYLAQRPSLFLRSWANRLNSNQEIPTLHFLIRRAAVVIQRGNTAAVLGTLPGWLFWPFHPSLFCMCIFHLTDCL